MKATNHRYRLCNGPSRYPLRMGIASMVNERKIKSVMAVWENNLVSRAPKAHTLIPRYQGALAETNGGSMSSCSVHSVINLLIFPTVATHGHVTSNAITQVRNVLHGDARRASKEQILEQQSWRENSLLRNLRLPINAAQRSVNSNLFDVPGSSASSANSISSSQVPEGKFAVTRLDNEATCPFSPYAAAEQGAFGVSAVGALNRVQAVAAEVQHIKTQFVAHFGPGIFGSFRPSNSALQNRGYLPNPRIKFPGQVPTHYLGDLNIPSNRSADIPLHENCALWITGLPANVNHHHLLGAIRGVGKVHTTVINPPFGHYTTSAAKLVFFEREQAEKLVWLIQSRRFIVMGKKILKVRWNKIKSARHPHPENSRVIRITGPEQLMDFDFFEDFFKSHFTYELDCKGIVPCSNPGSVSHEWHFGSLRCQAASAKTAIERELKGIFTVEWATDPCEQPWGYVADMQYI